MKILIKKRYVREMKKKTSSGCEKMFTVCKKVFVKKVQIANGKLQIAKCERNF